MVFGFSTGSLALGDFRLGLQMVEGKRTAAIELSALRDTELEVLIGEIAGLDLDPFQYVSVHAPSRFTSLSESEVVDLLAPVFARKWPVIVHPDVIEDFDLWRQHGSEVCIENMDKRKPFGRTANELSRIFHLLPGASFCFDIAHAQQIDPTMMEARKILKQHGHRLRQIHVSSVNSASRHERLSYPSLIGYQAIASLIPTNIPMILETPVSENEMLQEIDRAQSIFENLPS